MGQTFNGLCGLRGDMETQSGTPLWCLNEEQVETAVERENFARTLDDITGRTLQGMQRIIQILVNTRDHTRLTALQAATGELFKRASQTIEEGKYYAVDDSKPGDA